MLWCCRPAASKGKQKWAAAPEGRASRARIPAPGRSVAFTGTASTHLASTAPPPPGSGARQNRRDVIANQIFPQNVDKFVCGRGQPPAGVTHKRGLRPPLARPRRVGAPFLARRSTRNPLPARCGHIRCPLGTLPRVAGAQCAPLRSGVSRPSR